MKFSNQRPFSYPKAHENRLHPNDPAVRGPRIALFKLALKNFLLLQLLFLGLFAYIFGALFQATSHTHNLKVLYVDYDQGLVGTIIRNAYKGLQGDSFPTLIEKPGAEFPTPGDLREAVCKTRYWAALFVQPGASSTLETALTQPSNAYDKNDLVKYIWNEARYPTVVDSSISSNLQTLSATARIGYASHDWTTTITNTSAATYSTFADPWHLASINIQPTAQGSRLIYNTLVIILILIQEFFYLGTINGLYERFNIYSRLNPHRIIAFRFALSAAYTLIGSLCVAGMVWAFKAGWHVNGNQFALTWAILWLFAHVNFLTMDVFSVWLPPQFVPMALITWVIFNVASILLPFQLSAAFYRWAYVMPAHEVYQILIDIWSGGCNPTLSYALPILFIMELSSFCLSALGTHRRAHYALIKQEADKAIMQMRVDTAIKIEQENQRGLQRTRTATRSCGEIHDEKTEEQVDERTPEYEEQPHRLELARTIEKADEEIKRQQTRTSRNMHFGPSFGVSFGGGDD
ncbi:hypothetical protein EJ08DRAFT_11592 [Tothia fuscella]|uniref:DUF3533 domain-containing protein n=1 Tax=Tothia fuscella TaxID=1048955 RepID=A0A9P4U3N6_9PEZI|nr:hypothetical protein EJ08DRAFT_11592 [Tothia fuscella]